ncbi:MAG: hypothetical protein PVJ27_08010, partial [Candidatus Brocadiaceae bacterium]
MEWHARTRSRWYRALLAVLTVATAVLWLCRPRGPARAEEGAAPAQVRAWHGSGTWAFEPDEGLEGGKLDLRYLNEEVAGQHGFVRLSEDGNDFVGGDGTPIRFWGVAAHAGEKVSDHDLARHARFLARLGVNLVRIGGASPGLMPQEKGVPLTEPNPKFMDRVWRTVAAMKREGIYTRVSPFWDHGSVKYISPDWGIDGYRSGDGLNALLFFEPTLQEAYKTWMERLLTEENPYTGVPLKDDPALAIVQIVSEDTLLFWWLDRIKGGPRRELERRFGEFATGRYGSIQAALRAWDDAPVKGDAPSEGRLGLYPLYNLTLWPGTGNLRRIRDQVEFLARLERDFYADMERFLREEVGARQIIGPSNFHSASHVRLDDLQRWAWTAGDVIELNNFYGGTVRGPNSFWRIQAGHFFTRPSATRRPDIPPARKQVVGRPFNLSSTTWTLPNLYTMEGPIFGAAYSAMNGVDGLFWFAAQDATYDTDPYMPWATVKGSHPMVRWSISHPGFISQFPAAALIYRLGLVERAETVVHEVRTLDELLDRRAPLLTESFDYEPSEHVAEALRVKRPLMPRVRPEAYLVGRVELAYGGDPAESRVGDLSPYVDEETGEVRTTHGQLTLNPEEGLLRIDAPAAQGMVGFLKEAGGHSELSDLTIRSGNDYASIVAVAMDGRPLRSSAKVLVQVGTTCRPTGWKVKPATREQKEG